MSTSKFLLAALASLALGGAEECGTRMVNNAHVYGRPHDPKKRAKAKSARKARRRNR